MKLIGADTRFSIAGANVCFKDVDLNITIDSEDVTNNCIDRYQQLPKRNSEKARLTVSNFMDDENSDVANFIDLAGVGEAVGVISMTGVNDILLSRYGPWYISELSVKHNRTDSSENSMTLEGSGGAIDEAIP